MDEKSSMVWKLDFGMCELGNLKRLLSEKADKLSALEISCSSKQDIITHQANDLHKVESLCAELGDEVELLKKECEAAKQEVLFHQQLSERYSIDLTWLLKQGVSRLVRAVLNSEEFVNLSGALQNTALQLGMWEGCQRTHQAYPEQLSDCPFVVSEEASEELLMEQFARLVSHEYAPVGSLGSGAMGLEGLKQLLSVGESSLAGTGVEDDKGEEKMAAVSGSNEEKMAENESGAEEEKVLEPDDVLI